MVAKDRGWLVFSLACLLLAMTGGEGRTQVPGPDAPPQPGTSSQYRKRSTLPPGPGPIPTPVPSDLVPSQSPSALVPPPLIESAPALTIDQLLDRLENVRAQKAELERAEKVLMEKVREVMAKQKDRLVKLGVEVAPPPMATYSDLIPSPTVPPVPVPKAPK